MRDYTDQEVKCACGHLQGRHLMSVKGARVKWKRCLEKPCRCTRYQDGQTPETALDPIIERG